MCIFWNLPHKSSLNIIGQTRVEFTKQSIFVKFFFIFGIFNFWRKKNNYLEKLCAESFKAPVWRTLWISSAVQGTCWTSTNLFIHSFIHPSFNTPIHSFILSFIHSFIHSHIYLPIHLFILSFIHSLINLFIHSFIYPFIL